MPFRATVLWLALGLAQFGGLALAAYFYPAHYHWTTDVMSCLTEPHFNPRGWWIGSLALALTGLLLLPFPRLLHARLANIAPRRTQWAGRFLYLGAGLLILAAAIPGHVPALGRTHEDLAQAFGAAISLATIFYFAAAQGLPRRFMIQRHAGLVLVVVPFGAFAFSRVYLIVESYRVTHAAFREMNRTGWTSLSLWEWIAAGGTWLFLGTLALGLPAVARSSAR